MRALPRPVSMNRDPVKTNAHIFRVHARRLSNPAEKDIFVTSATKLAGFLDNRRAYYEEAQQPVRLLGLLHPSFVIIFLTVVSFHVLLIYR